MFTAIISTFFGSLATILWKNSLKYNATKEIFILFGYTSIFLITFLVYVFGELNFSGINIIIISIILLMTLIGYIRDIIEQKSYTIDKISTLIPYSNINKILSIIFSFFIWGDISLITLIITLLTIIVIIAFSIDFKLLKIPQSILMFSFSQVLTSILILLTGYLLLHISDISLFILSYIGGLLFVGIIVFFKKTYKEVKTLSKQFYGYRLTACHLWGFSYLLSLFVIKDLGLSITILLSFLGIGITLLFSYIFLKDIPSKKDIILTIIVSTLVGLGYYFK